MEKRLLPATMTLGTQLPAVTCNLPPTVAELVPQLSKVVIAYEGQAITTWMLLLLQQSPVGK